MIPGLNTTPLEWFTSLSDQHKNKSYAYGVSRPLCVGLNRMPPFQYQIDGIGVVDNIQVVNVATGAIVEVYNRTSNPGGVPGLSLQNIGTNTNVIYDGVAQYVGATFAPGVYYSIMEIDPSTGANYTLYSEEYSTIQNIDSLLKLSWWHAENFTHENGEIYYSTPTTYKNFFYFGEELGRPDYVNQDQVQERNGIVFPVRQISYKQLKFVVVVTEGILDVIKIINQHHYKQVEYKGKTYSINWLTYAYNWLQNGDVASVEIRLRVGASAALTGTAQVLGEYSAEAYGDGYNT